jgi:hypothetical protein
MDLSWELPLAGPPGSATGILPLDLSSQPEVWSQRERISELRVDAILIEVVALGEQNGASEARLVIGHRPTGAAVDGSGDLTLVQVERLALAEGASAALESAPGLAAALGGALEGSGRFDLVARIEAEGPVSAVLRLSIQGSALLEVDVR